MDNSEYGDALYETARGSGSGGSYSAVDDIMGTRTQGRSRAPRGAYDLGEWERHYDQVRYQLDKIEHAIENYVWAQDPHFVELYWITRTEISNGGRSSRLGELASWYERLLDKQERKRIAKAHGKRGGRPHEVEDEEIYAKWDEYVKTHPGAYGAVKWVINELEISRSTFERARKRRQKQD